MLNQHSKKHHHAGPPNIVPEPLGDPGNPSHRYQARSTAHLDRPCSRMVALAANSPGRRTPRSPQTKNATVMLGSSPDDLMLAVYRHSQSRVHGSPFNPGPVFLHPSTHGTPPRLGGSDKGATAQGRFMLPIPMTN